MDLIIRFPKIMRQHDSVMDVMDRLTKVEQFIPIKSTFLAIDVAWVFIRDVVRLHGIPKKIVLDRDAKFTSKLWKKLFAILGTNLAFSMAYHP